MSSEYSQSRTHSSTIIDTHEYGGGGHGGGAPDFDLKRMLILRAPMILAIGILLSIPTVALAWFLIVPTFEASAEIRFFTVTPRVLEGSSAGHTTPYRQFVATEISMITGRTIIEEALAEPHIQALPALAEIDSPLSYIRSQIDARTRGNSELVEVTLEMEDPEAARAILHEVITKYLEYAERTAAEAGGERLAVLQRTRETLQLELELLLRQIAQRQSQLSQYDTAAPTFEFRTEGDMYREYLLNAEERVSELQNRLSEIESQIDRVHQLQELYLENPERPIYEFEIEARINTDGRLIQFSSNLASQEADLRLMEQRQRETSPMLRAKRLEIESMRESMKLLNQQIRGEMLSTVLAQKEMDRQAAQNNLTEALRRVETHRLALEEYNRNIDERREQEAAERAALDELRSSEQQTRNLLQNIQRQISEINLESNAPARVQLATAANVSSGRSFARNIRFSILAIMGSFGIAFMLGFLRELTDQEVRSPRDLERLSSQPVLAAIPHLSVDSMHHDADINFMTSDFPNSMIADNYRRVLARFLYPEEGTAELNSLLIVSPSRGDGKTALAMNIAIALEQAKRRVLLVDLNPQRPEIEKLFGIENSEGLSEILAGAREAEEVVQGTEFEQLFVLGPGLLRKRLSGQLASREMMDFMEWAEGEFNHIIFDSPPMLIMSDAKLLAPAVDGVVMVVGAGISSRGRVQRCIHDMEHLAPNIVGIVLNGMRRFRGGYLHRDQEQFYGYSKAPSAPSEQIVRARKSQTMQDDIPEMKIVNENDTIDLYEDEDNDTVVLLTYEDEENQPKATRKL